MKAHNSITPVNQSPHFTKDLSWIILNYALSVCVGRQQHISCLQLWEGTDIAF